MPNSPGREPDLFFLAMRHRDRLTSRQLEGPADLVVEVISDESVARDRSGKFYEYQAAGIPEYWILDARPNRQRADFYVRDVAGKYQAVPVASDGVSHSTVLAGFWLRLGWLWDEEAAPLAALGEIVGIDRVIHAMRGGSNL